MSVPFLLHLYPWTKALHLIALIAWMAGLLYLPRLFVYHCEALPGTATSELFKVMEFRLYKYIMTPAMLATFLFGILLALTPGLVDWHAGWFYVKLVAVLLLAGAQGAMSRWRKDFLADQNRRPQKFFRIANEVPTVLMLVAVVMVVVQPF
jgi:putative membrane protein